jgi:hypothetical protein
MAIGARLDMAAERGGPALHNGASGAADVGGQRMGLFVRRKRVLEDRLQGDGAHPAPSGVAWSVADDVG